MKRIIIVLIMALTATMAIFSQTEADFKVELTKDGEGVVITEYLGKVAKVQIPAKIQGMPVREIGDSAFYPRTVEITSVIIPTGVTKIGEGAFSSQKKLTTINLPNTVTSIGDEAFDGCTALTSINLDNVSFIGSKAFSWASLKTVTLSPTLKKIGSSAFSSNFKLETIIIPEGVETIGIGVFAGCELLSSIDLPTTIKEIDDKAFYNCSNLISITIPEKVGQINFVFNSFQGCSKLPLSVQAVLKKHGYKGKF